MLLWALISRYVIVHDAICLGKLLKGKQGSIGKLLASQVVDTCREEAYEIRVRDAGRGIVPVNERGVMQLGAEGGGTRGLESAVCGQGREGFNVGQEA